MKSSSKLIIAEVEIRTETEKYQSHISLIVQTEEDINVAIKNQIMTEMIRLQDANVSFAYDENLFYWKFDPSLIHPEDDPRSFIASVPTFTSYPYKSIDIKKTPTTLPSKKNTKKRLICYGCQQGAPSQKDHMGAGGCMAEESSSSSPNPEPDEIIIDFRSTKYYKNI